MSKAPEEILNFWFMEIDLARRFAPDDSLDEVIRKRFMGDYESAVRGDYKVWEDTPEGMLALMLLFSAFPRRMFRGTALAYAADALALELARTAIIKHFDDRIDRAFKLYFYLPFSYSENPGDQRLAVYYVRERTKIPEWVDAAEERQQVVRCFGRFPHRNAALNRTSTAEEIEYMAQVKAEV